ncbi:polyketide cyclase [Kribbella turkmenica]|uniref:Polyketide cyclase n=1 Tax=Kribbella turkmenica TaxID=2530375 RepID=A0A4R4WVF0_9ACTN|nr:SRPBCC domain-containing protein [Kribbella turkmenica]TDD21654.1 polyketide cyclase [Kribbella turkmenica]
MGQRSIDREIHIDAAPEVVYEVVSKPEHVRAWWPDEADYEPAPGATGTIAFTNRPDGKFVPLTVIEADPPRRFVFRWAYALDEVATVANSLLVTFDLVPAGAGTLLRFSETGFDESATPDEVYHDHVTGWDYFLPRLTPYVDRLVSAP